MGFEKYFDNAIKRQMLDLHTAFLGKVVSVNGKTATVQPLGLIKQVGESAKKQAVLPNLPIATHKARTKTITYVSGITQSKADGNVTDIEVTKDSIEVSEVVPIEKGDIVICVCCDRDITEARKGNNSLPVIGHHSLSDSVIVGVL